MRTLRILVLLFICGTSSQVNAQFWKKLKDRAKEAAERTVERKIEEKTERETETAFDSVFNNQGKLFKGKKMPPAEFYQFNSFYVMRLVQKKDTLLMTSYFGEDENVLGSSVEIRPNEKVISVIDLNQNQIHSFMDFGDQKTKTSIPFSPNKIEDATDMKGVSIEPNGQDKEILGYWCKGYKVKGKEYHGTVWITDETEISYPKGFSELQIKNAKHSGVDHKWMTLIDGLALEMDMTVTSKRKPQQVHMLCVELGETDKTIDTNTYKSAF